MLTSLLAAALALQSASAPAKPITQEQRALLRCAAAFAIVSNAQASGQASAQHWPELGTRGREFFVRAMAHLMDQTGVDRAGVAQLAHEEAQALATGGDLPAIMPSCLLMLEASGV